MERCQSGRLGRSRKPVWRQRHRGFESLPLRCHLWISTVIYGAEIAAGNALPAWPEPDCSAPAVVSFGPFCTPSVPSVAVTFDATVCPAVPGLGRQLTSPRACWSLALA